MVLVFSISPERLALAVGQVGEGVILAGPGDKCSTTDVCHEFLLARKFPTSELLWDKVQSHAQMI